MPALAGRHRVIAPDHSASVHDRPARWARYSVDWPGRATCSRAARRAGARPGQRRGQLVRRGAGPAPCARFHADRVDRLVLMGSRSGCPSTITQGLDAVWGFEPSVEAMRRLMSLFAYDTSLLTDDLARDPVEAAMATGRRRFAAMFPAPRQRRSTRWLAADDLSVGSRSPRCSSTAETTRSSRSTPPAAAAPHRPSGSCTSSASAATGCRSSGPSEFNRLVSDFLTTPR